MEEILHHVEAMGKPLFIGIYRGLNTFQGFLGGVKWISSIHSTAFLVEQACKIAKG